MLAIGVSLVSYSYFQKQGFLHHLCHDCLKFDAAEMNIILHSEKRVVLSYVTIKMCLLPSI